MIPEVVKNGMIRKVATEKGRLEKAGDMLTEALATPTSEKTLTGRVASSSLVGEFTAGVTGS